MFISVNCRVLPSGNKVVYYYYYYYVSACITNLYSEKTVVFFWKIIRVWKVVGSRKKSQLFIL